MSSSIPKYTSKLQDTRVLVLGGTSGIGFCVAEAALEHNAHVYISSSQQPKLESALSRLKTSYPDKASHIFGHKCDLSQLSAQEANIDALLKFAAGDSKIDHIVFTAGDMLKIIPIGEITPESIEQTGTVRFFGMLMLAKLAPQYMAPGPKSSITLTGGSASHRPMKGWTVLAAFGSGTEGMTRGLAVDLAPIRVNMVSPGAVHTELFGSFPEERLEGILQSFKDATLVGKVGTPEDVAEAYLYAMKDQFLTGSLLESNGGRLLK